jgi:hypothetical protein
VTKILNALRNALDGARRDLDAIRDRISDLQDKRRHIEGAPAHRALIEQRINAEIARVRGTLSIHFPDVSAPSGRLYAGDFNARFKDNPFALLAAYDPEGLKAALLAQMPSDGLTAEERTAQLVKIDADLLAAEMAEETVLREIEAGTGTAMPRRADADPRVLLAPTEELQG